MILWIVGRYKRAWQGMDGLFPPKRGVNFLSLGKGFLSRFFFFASVLLAFRGVFRSARAAQTHRSANQAAPSAHGCALFDVLRSRALPSCMRRPQLGRVQYGTVP